MDEIREPIKSTMSVKEMIYELGERSLAAIDVLIKLFFQGGEEDKANLLKLDDMNIRGAQISMGFKYFCKRNLSLFLKNIVEGNKDMVDSINLMNYSRGSKYKAVTQGARTNGYETFTQEDIKNFGDVTEKLKCFGV
jgi:hypothetical protein